MDMEIDNDHKKQCAISCTPYFQRFLRKDEINRRFFAQYSHVYSLRLLKLRPLAIQSAHNDHPSSRGIVLDSQKNATSATLSMTASSSSSSSSSTKIQMEHDVHVVTKVADRVIDLRTGDLVIAAGTLYKEQVLKPCVLEEFALESQGKPPKPFQPSEMNMYSDREKDFLILEDESGRINITGLPQELVNILVSGVVAAVKGRLLESGDFQADQIWFPGFSVQSSVPRHLKNPQEPVYLMLISSLHLGIPKTALASQLLCEFIAGHINPGTSSRFGIFMIAGGTLVPEHSRSDSIDDGRSFDDPLSVKEQVHLLNPLKQADVLLSEITSTVAVDLLPGGADPTNLTFPQQPMNAKVLFPNTTNSIQNLRSVSNPYECLLMSDHIRVIGHSGQPVQDILKYTWHDPNSTDYELDVLEKTLRWGHLAPTCPDTLPCYPFHDIDPFIIDSTPHIFFSGNSKHFGTRLVRGEQNQMTRIITIPRFSETGQVVLINLTSEELDASIMNFSVN